MNRFHIALDYNGKKLEGEVIPQSVHSIQGIPLKHKLILNGEDKGLIVCTSQKWHSTKIKDQKLVDTIGNYITEWYE